RDLRALDRKRTTDSGRTARGSPDRRADGGRRAGANQVGESRRLVSSRAVADLAALKSAVRAAIVIPAVFALADKVIEQPQTSILAAFGSFAMLVLVEFAGPPRSRFVAYVALACAGAAFITLGTLCSRNAWLAAGTMA